MEFDRLPADIQVALHAIYEGSTAGDQETECLDFKEDPAVHPQERNPDGSLVETLRDTSICLINGDGGETHIVLGVADKISGSAAFTGTDRELQWVERQISNGTVPPLRVEAYDFFFHDVRLIWIRIPEGLTFYSRTKGNATYRVGARCKPASEEIRRAIQMKRLNPDFSAKVSPLGVEDLMPEALNYARKLVRTKLTLSGQDASIPGTNEGLLRELGLLTKEGKLSTAAEILFAPVDRSRITVRYSYRTVPGGSAQTTEISLPLTLAIGQVSELVERHTSQEISRVQLSNGQETAIAAFPRQAVDEMLINAFAHRDWAMIAPVLIEQTPGTLSVVSPGSLPFGVTKNKLLTTPSIPRNPTLINALRIMGLAEESSRGFDRMWAAMLQTGRDVPEIDAQEMYVKVTLAAGKPDIAFIRGLHNLAQIVQYDVIFSVSTLLILHHLHHKPLITLNEVIEQTQVSRVEAQELMQLLVDRDVLSSVGGKIEQWVLSVKAKVAYGEDSKKCSIRQPVEEWIKEQLEHDEAVTSRAVSQATGISRKEITAILTRMRDEGLVMIDLNGPQRGPNTRWVTTKLR